MAYFKIICDGTIAGVGLSENFCRHQLEHNVLQDADIRSAQFMQIRENLYRDGSWMQPIERDFFSYKDARILAIDEEEYNALFDSLEKNEVVMELEEPEPVEALPEEVAETPEEEVTAEFVRDVKIKELSLACNKAITAGFDLELSDGELHHFSMSLEDQANLNTASMQILGGDEEIPYHADGEEYKMYSSEDMVAVIGAANQHKLKELAYFGCLKAWVNGLVRIKSIQEIEYGSELPKKYQSALFKRMCE